MLPQGSLGPKQWFYVGGESALKLSWGPRMCALRQSFYEAPGICLGEESLIKETPQPFMFFILGERGRVYLLGLRVG